MLVFKNGPQSRTAVEEHYLWLKDAEGHSVTIFQTIDPVEEPIMKRAKEFKKKFSHQWNKLVEEKGYLRAVDEETPSFLKLTSDADLEMSLFLSFYQQI
jgi:hypothetical protein